MVAVKPLTVHWHQDSAPIYSACFQPQEGNDGGPPHRSRRLATAGGDNNVRMWRLRMGSGLDETPGVEYLATLSKHERAVNAVAFDDSGKVLASAGDDGVVCLWALGESSSAPVAAFGSEFEEIENWKMIRKCRTASFGEIYDLAWSPSGRFLAATSMDKIVSILDTTDGTCIAALRDHKHYVQGVAWDPKGQYLATQSSDQRVIVYALKEEKNGKLTIDAPLVRLEKAELPGNRQSSFHPESFSSFFRRLSFSPDGMLLLVPAAQIDQKLHANETVTDSSESAQPISSEAFQQAQATDSSKTEEETRSNNLLAEKKQHAPTQNCALIYARGDLRKPSGIVLLPKQSTVVRFCPTLFKRTVSEGAQMGYKMVYAIATLNGVFIYDTENHAPLGMASNLHYSSLTDLAWSPDGRILLLTSIDGFCSVVRFEEGELGNVYKDISEQSQTEDAPALNGVSTTEPAVNVLSVRRKSRPAAASKAPSDPPISDNSSSAAASAVPTP